MNGSQNIVAAGAALAWGMAVTVGAYAIVRGIQFFLYPDPNPATLVWSAHSGFFWRCWTVGYAGGLASFVAFLAAQRSQEGVVRSLPFAIVTSALLLALQTAVFP
jgi:hypothetical protein